jgi:ADP-heptose:LPS heptosyltransferase
MTRALLYCAGGGIGDSLVASVVARALHARFDRVDALTLPGHRETLERVPDIDDVLVDDGGDEHALAALLRAREYAASVVTWATARTAKIPALAKIPVRVGQARRLYSHQFTHRVAVRSESGDVTSHWTDILLDYARALDCDTVDRHPAFAPTDADHAEARAAMATILPPGSAFVVLHPTNAIAPRRGIWPIEGWAALARALREHCDAHVLISGSPADVAINDAIVARAADPRVVNIAGRVGIGGFAALVQQAAAFVGITTGSMHVAAAAGAPTLGIFPFQSDFPERWAPLGTSTAIVRASYPCHAGDTKELCADYACIAHLDTQRIVAALESLIGGNRARHDSTVHL